MARIIFTVAAVGAFTTVTMTAQAQGRWQARHQQLHNRLAQPRDHELFHTNVGTYGARQATRMAATVPWNGQYSHTATGRPVALILPPTAQMTNSWSWGVNQSQMYPIYHQFGRNYPGQFEEPAGMNPYLPTPPYPSHTDQFGVYPIRGPW